MLIYSYMNTSGNWKNEKFNRTFTQRFEDMNFMGFMTWIKVPPLELFHGSKSTGSPGGGETWAQLELTDT